MMLKHMVLLGLAVALSVMLAGCPVSTGATSAPPGIKMGDTVSFTLDTGNNLYTGKVTQVTGQWLSTGNSNYNMAHVVWIEPATN